MPGTCLSVALTVLLAASAAAGPPVAEVSYDSSTETITVSPDPIPVPSGVFIVNWLKAHSQENAPWRFQGLEVMSAPAGCFDNPVVHDRVISLLDKNSQTSCNGTFKYSITVYDETKSKAVTLDPEIENMPGG